MIRAQVKRTIVERGLLSRGDHVLVACSGGPDSTVLTHVLHGLRGELGITLCVASVDHGLRVESPREVEAVGALAGRLGLPFYPLRIDVAQGTALQARARAARYDALKQAAQEAGATRIAVGHTMDDQAETVLSRLLRGSGVFGLSAISPARPDHIIRPLIDCLHGDIVEYARFHRLPFSEDPSNENRAFERVRLRTHILPQLEQEDPQLIPHLAALADEAGELRAWLNEELLAHPETAGHRLCLDRLRGLPKPVALGLIARWVDSASGIVPGRAHLTDLFGLLSASGEVLLGSGWAVQVDRNDLVIDHNLQRDTRSSRPKRR